MRKRKGIIGLLLITCFVCTSFLSLSGCQSKGGAGDDANHFTWFLTSGVSTEYYMNYSDNPAIKYLSQYKTFQNSAGEEEHITFEFLEPAAGQGSSVLQTELQTDTYQDVMELTFYGGSVAELYEAGIILDLEEYIDKYMPNYKAYLEANPELFPYTAVKGENKLLSLISYKDVADKEGMFAGWCYRRDWIVTYGKQPDTLFDPRTDSVPRPNPNAGKAFTGYWSLDEAGNEIRESVLKEHVDDQSWVDDVVFPSGHSDPVYISDWEWMMEIFERAIADLGISDGYAFSMYYPGYIANGDFETGFGGGSPSWYYDDDTNRIVFGATGDNFKAYLECMNSWYAKGWLDQSFDQRAGEMFYRVNEKAFCSGKVGCWMGASSNLGGALYNADEPLTERIVVFGAASPINDIYGGKEQQLKEPDTFFTKGREGRGIYITKKAKKKDLALLFRCLDYMYSEEGAMLCEYGLNKEQYDECQDAFYQKYGLADGAYTRENRDEGEVLTINPVIQKKDLKDVVAARAFFHRSYDKKVVRNRGMNYEYSTDQWNRYKCTGFTAAISVEGDFSSVDTTKFGKIAARVENEYMYINVPKFIKGTLSLDKDWDGFVKDLEKRGCNDISEAYNEILEQNEK